MYGLAECVHRTLELYHIWFGGETHTESCKDRRKNTHIHLSENKKHLVTSGHGVLMLDRPLKMTIGSR